jgi:hypothetical protein
MAKIKRTNRLRGKKKRDEAGRFASTETSVASRRYIRSLKNRLTGRKLKKGEDIYNEKGKLKQSRGGRGSRASKTRIPRRK